jgi:AcrR family transcriptional regulator
VIVTKATAQGTPRESIIRAATVLFGRESFPATSMRDIAGEVGILAGSLYAHIDGKESLLLEIIEQGIGEFLEAVSAASTQPGPAVERLRAMMRAHVEVVSRDPLKTQIVFHQWRYLGEDNRRRVRAKRSRYEDLFREVIEAGVADGSFDPETDVRIAVLSTLGSLNWTSEWISAEGPTPVEQLSAQLADTMLNGIIKR